jgi:hypothetical protein
MDSIGLRFRLFAVLMSLLVISGCDEKNFFVTTIVSVDGAIDRMVEWRGVSDSTKWNRLPIPVDSTWRMTFRPAASRDSMPVLTASKHFPSHEAFAAEYGRPADPAKVRVEVNVASRFRWFYTYYDYDETYADPNPAAVVPMGEFFAAAEMADIQAGRFSDTLSSRIKEWARVNAKHRFVDRIAAAAERSGDTALSAPRMTAKRALLEQVLLGDSIYAGLEHDSSLARMAFDDPSKHALFAAAAVNPAMRALRDIVASPAVDALREPVEKAFDEYLASENKIEGVQGSYTNTVVMPGVLLETNASEVSGSRASWKVEGSRILTGKVSMTAVSRCVNAWAIVVSALVVAGLVIIPVFFARRKPVV